MSPIRSWPKKACGGMPISSNISGPSTRLSSALHERAAALIKRTESLLRRDGRPELVIIPRTLRFFRLLHFEQIHRMDVPAVDADLALSEQPVLGRHLLHLGDHGRAVRIRPQLLQGLEVMQH